MARSIRAVRLTGNPGGDLGTGERAQRQAGVLVEPVARDLRGGVTTQRSRARVECVLDAYWHRCQVVDRQHEAGMVFRTYWYRAHGVQRLTSRYDAAPRAKGGGGDSDGASASRLDAQRRLTAACGVLTPAQQSVVIAVCGMDEWAGGSERLATLRRGLTALADYWQIDMPPRLSV